MNETKMDELLRMMRAVVPDESGMSDAGKVSLVFKGDYDESTQYEELDIVKFGMSLWTPKQDTMGNPPPDQSQEGQENVEENEFWVLFLPGALGSDYVKKTDIAKQKTDTYAGKAGISYPDGKTIFADENGMLTGATAGKRLTQEEMNDQLTSGELETGNVVFLTGPAEGTDGLVVKVDAELNADSVHAIRNSAVTNAINAANALIAENQRLIAETQALRATLESFGLSKICPVGVTDATEANGMVLGAFEKNASIDGTLAHKANTAINDVQNPNTLKAYLTSGDNAFDFDSSNHKPGIYKVDNCTNLPSSTARYGNTLVVKENGGDTLAMLVFPFEKNGEILYKTATTNTWKDAKWFRIIGEELQ